METKRLARCPWKRPVISPGLHWAPLPAVPTFSSPRSSGVAARPQEAQPGGPIFQSLRSTLHSAGSGAHKPGRGAGQQGVQANPAEGSYLYAGIRPTRCSLLLGLRGWGGSHRLGSRRPPP